jgi:hypothetical protein
MQDDYTLFVAHCLSEYGCGEDFRKLKGKFPLIFKVMEGMSKRSAIDILGIAALDENKYEELSRHLFELAKTHRGIDLVLFGDLLTVIRIRCLCLLLLSAEKESDWPEEATLRRMLRGISASDFHCWMALVKGIWRLFVTPDSKGLRYTLGSMLVRLGRTSIGWDSKKLNSTNKAASDFLDTVLDGHLLAIGADFFSTDTNGNPTRNTYESYLESHGASGSSSAPTRKDWLLGHARMIVKLYVGGRGTSSIRSSSAEWVHFQRLVFMLLFKRRFDLTMQFGDGERNVANWKVLMPFFGNAYYTI